MNGVDIICRCGVLAQQTTHSYLSPSLRDVHRLLRAWMQAAGLDTWVDAVGNLRGVYGEGPRIMIGGPADSGTGDGILGVLLGIALAERRPPCAVEIVAFSGEHGMPFGAPFLGSQALIGAPVMEERVLAAIRDFGLEPAEIPAAALDPAVKGYLEFQVEPGAELEHLQLPLGIVDGIAGLSCWELRLKGEAIRTGTRRLVQRPDALAGAAEWIGLVEHVAETTSGLTAIAGAIEVEPGVGSLIPAVARVNLQVRHELDEVRERACEVLLNGAEQIAERRSLTVEGEPRLEQPAAALHFAGLEEAMKSAGFPVHRMRSPAGHDAMILARKIPASMVFLRSASAEDVDAALAAGTQLLRTWQPE